MDDSAVWKRFMAISFVSAALALFWELIRILPLIYLKVLLL